MTALPPLCFVLMPFGTKTDSSGGTIDFDLIYETVFKPAVESAGMEPLRADEERDGGIIHKAMFERLILCSYALADLTMANANVFYELGVRHAVRPHTTVLTFEQGAQRLPFDVAPLRALPYEVDPKGKPIRVDELKSQITKRLNDAREPHTDSPVYQLLEDITPPDIARLKTDVFRDRVKYDARVKEELAVARTNKNLAEVHSIQNELNPLGEQEAGVLIDLMLTYRELSDHQAMLEVFKEMPVPVQRCVLVQEQKAFALNRLERHDEAERVLTQLLKEQGPSSETLGLLGRIHKDRWKEAHQANRDIEADGHLHKAISTYRMGFETDWRDAFPGINLITLLAVAGDQQNELPKLLPVVKFAVERRLASGNSDYWDHASMLELCVIERNDHEAIQQLSDCLACNPADWERTTTVNNLNFLLDAKKRRSDDVRLLEQVIGELSTF